MAEFAQIGNRAEQTFEFQEVLGKGNFSTVYKGIHRKSHQPVALKVLTAEGYRHDERKKQLIRNEVAIMAEVKRINHDNLMKFHHIYEDTAKIVMVLEYLEGGELFDRIVSKGHYSEKDASQAILALMEGLHVMHMNGLLHRDIKPENIVYAGIEEFSPLKLSDFGLAAKLPSNCTMIRDRNLCGTPSYIAPEVLSRHLYSPAADIWSAGVILYILLSGVTPFYGKTHKEIFDRIKQGAWRFTSKFDNISEEAKDLVRRMLTHDFRERITYEEFLKHPWIQKWEDLANDHLEDTVKEISKFNGKRRFRAAAMATIASNRLKGLLLLKAAAKKSQEVESFLQKDSFTIDQISKLKNEFEKAAGTSGSLTLDQFEQVMSSLNLDHLPADRIFEMFDTDGNGDLDYKEFLLGISKFNLTGDDALKFCFEVMDEDKSGTLTKEELTKVLIQLYQARDEEEDEREQVKQEDIMILEEAQGNREKEEANTSSTTPSTSTSPNLHFFADDNVSGVVDSTEASNDFSDENNAISIKSPVNGREMDPYMYELLESISTLFEDLDANNDNLITLEEFIDGCKRHPDVMALFFNAENTDNLLNTSFRSSTSKLLGV